MHFTLRNFIIYIIFGTINSFGQGLTDMSLQKMKLANDAKAGIVNFDDINSYVGSPYENYEFVLGSVYQNDTLKGKDIPLRFNVVSKQFEVKETLFTPNSEISNLEKIPNLIIKINDKTFELTPFNGSFIQGDYLEVLYTGTQVDLYKKHYKDVRYPIKASTSLTRDVPAKFTDEPTYFIVTKRKKFYELPKSRNNKFKVFGQNENLMEKYAKKSKLDINEEKDLITLVEYFEKQ